MADNISQAETEELLYETVEAAERPFGDAEYAKTIRVPELPKRTKKAKAEVKVEPIKTEEPKAEDTKEEFEVVGLDGKPVKKETSKEQPKKEDAKAEDTDTDDLTPEEKASLEILNQFENIKDDEEPTASAEKGQEKTDEPKKEVVEVKDDPKVAEIQAKYEELNNDPYVKALLAFKESGKDITELPSFLGIKNLPTISSFKNPSDGDKAIMEDLIKEEIEKLGLPKADVADAIQEQMEKWDEMDTLQRKAFYDAKINAKKSELSETLKSFKYEPKKDPYVEYNGRKINTNDYSEPEKAIEIIKKGETELNTFLQSKIGTTVGHLIISQKVIDKVMPTLIPIINNLGVERDANKRIKEFKITDAMFNKAVKAEYSDKITQLALEAQKTHLKREALKERHLPDGGNTRTSVAANLGYKSVDQARDEKTGKIKYI